MLFETARGVRRCAWVALFTLALIGPSQAGSADQVVHAGPVVPVANFVANPAFEVEGLAMSPENDLYVGLPFEGLIYRVRPNGRTDVHASFGYLPDQGYLLGLVVAADRSLFAAVWGCGTATNGIWHVDRIGNAALVAPIPGDQCQSAPNALSFDEDGHLYVTDSLQGTVWRLGKNGDAAVWARDDLLLPAGVFGFGANGIAYRDRSLWVLNTDTGSIIEIPIARDGSAGEARVFVRSELLVGMDGGQFDVAGNMYVGNFASGNLLRVSKHGHIAVIVDPKRFNGERWPTNPVFGFGHERSTIFISGANPSVVKVDVGVPGLLMPQFAPRDRGRRHEAPPDHSVDGER